MGIDIYQYKNIWIPELNEEEDGNIQFACCVYLRAAFFFVGSQYRGRRIFEGDVYSRVVFNQGWCLIDSSD